MRRLPRSFYARNTIDVAIDLLGCHIISNVGDIKTGGMIVEAEAYIGEDDEACHAHPGPTARNLIMYGKAGMLYVYFTYGMYNMMNIITERPGIPAAVLIRAIEPTHNIEEMAHRRSTQNSYEISSGPGKLTQALGITVEHKGADLCGSNIYVKGPREKKIEIMASPRVGIGDRWHEKLWRFFIKDNPHVSKVPKIIRQAVFELYEARKMGFTL
jgi:DNA-3-methyladenine glycosylase